eukprot:Gb_10213 [translate_table: standard]
MVVQLLQYLWDILCSLQKLMDCNITPKMPPRGTITTSRDLVPLSYIEGLLTTRPNSHVVTLDIKELIKIESLKVVGRLESFQLQPKEGLISAIASFVCFHVDVMALLLEVLSALLNKVIFSLPLMHQLKHHLGQIEDVVMMEFLLDGSDYMKEAKKPHKMDPLSKPK